jgi:hypothetical protein
MAGHIDGNMSRWQRRVDDLLYDGETVRENLDVGSARVVVTSHRVLTFTPALEGENFRQADRPNVTGVDTSALAPANLLRRGLMAGVAGVVLMLAGLLFDPTSLFGENLELDTAAGNEFGLGGLMDATRSMFALLMNLDTVFLNLGALALLLSTVLLGVYWYLRTPTLIIELAGDHENVHVPRPANAGDVGYQLEEAILPDPDAGEIDTATEADTAATDRPEFTEDSDTVDESEAFIDDEPDTDTA